MAGSPAAAGARSRIDCPGMGWVGISRYLQLGLRNADTLTLSSLQLRLFVVSLAGDLELASVLLSYELFIKYAQPCNGHTVFLV